MDCFASLAMTVTTTGHNPQPSSRAIRYSETPMIPLEPVIGLAEGATRWRSMTVAGWSSPGPELASVADQRQKHPAHLGLRFLHPRFQRRKVRCVAGPRHHPQQIFPRCFRFESLGDAEPQDLREVMIKSC